MNKSKISEITIIIARFIRELRSKDIPLNLQEALEQIERINRKIIVDMGVKQSLHTYSIELIGQIKKTSAFDTLFNTLGTLSKLSVYAKGLKISLSNHNSIAE
jgi:hypothetical protein